ncbi:hypothetical protein ACFQXB_03885 [Plastorhodobacter daqingensis]|uniref:Glycosyl transferase n=1 Tax=Plastorhodobacter daqingensis TaxID=1387281 RepID=A0ABW2UGL5_9RHOB
MTDRPFNVFIIGQNNRLQYEAVLFAASLRKADPAARARLFIGEPVPNHLWDGDPRITGPARALLEDLGATFVPFEAREFGRHYPQGNKIEALTALPKGEPFVFFDTDTLFTGPLDRLVFDFDRPSASMRREGTWPIPELYGPGYTGIWKSLYDRFGLDFDSSLDLALPDEYWGRYLYFNAGWFFYRCPHEFGARFLSYACEIRDNPPPELVCQTLWPWLDQIALPLVIHSLGGGRPGPDLAGLDGDVSCHYRLLPLLYARESDAAVAMLEEICNTQKYKKVLREHQPVKKMVFRGDGARIRSMFDRADLPRREQAIRNAIKREGLWLR